MTVTIFSADQGLSLLATAAAATASFTAPVVATAAPVVAAAAADTGETFSARSQKLVQLSLLCGSKGGW